MNFHSLFNLGKNRRIDLQPEIDVESINIMASAAPNLITFGGR